MLNRVYGKNNSRARIMVSFRLPPGNKLVKTIIRIIIAIELIKIRIVNAIVYTKMFFSTEKINFMVLVNFLKTIVEYLLQWG